MNQSNVSKDTITRIKIDAKKGITEEEWKETVVCLLNRLHIRVTDLEHQEKTNDSS
ncbi:hypothetical protein LCGC14_2691440 [marine sediment metagenome]|uniref:Uncharacterized protein n=1 Tax=marine sediment metagenome TaxID=412755 RepID=A0A0F9CA63_9ZZZZ